MRKLIFIRQLSLQRKIIIIFALVALVLVTIIFITFVTIVSYREKRDLVTRTNEVLNLLDDTLVSINDAETSQRGYLLTGDLQYLEPYNASITILPQYLDNLRNLTSDYSSQQQRLKTLSALLNTKLAELKETINLRQTVSLEAALQVVRTNVGKQTMDNIRQIVLAMRNEENNLLQDRVKNQNTNDIYTLLSVSILVLFNAAFFSLIYYLVGRDINRRRQVEAEIRGLNASLEQHVVERTSELAKANQSLKKEVVLREAVLNRLRLLSEISTILASSFNYEGILQEIANHTILYPGDYCLIDIADDLNTSSFRRVAIANADSAQEALARKLAQEYPPDWFGTFLMAQTIKDGKAVVANEFDDTLPSAEALEAEQFRLFKHLNPKSAMSVPFRVRDRLIGVLSVVNNEKAYRYSSEDVNLAQEIAQRLTVALDNAQLYSQTQKDLNTQRELDYYKDLFMSVASHELRTPLTSIKGYAQILQRNLLGQAKLSPQIEPGQEKLLRSVERIIYQSNRMNELVDQLLNFSRIQSHQLELKYSPDLNLNELIERIVEQHRQNPRNHNIALQLPDQRLVGSFDAGRIEQVLDNLINNALKYSPAETTVTVGLEASRRIDTDPSIQALIWIRDEGHGISKEAQEHIFDPFYRVRTHQNAVVEGLGLGLYVSNEIVRQHGGRMWLESQPGEGSTFYLSLPLTPTS